MLRYGDDTREASSGAQAWRRPSHTAGCRANRRAVGQSKPPPSRSGLSLAYYALRREGIGPSVSNSKRAEAHDVGMMAWEEWARFMQCGTPLSPYPTGYARVIATEESGAASWEEGCVCFFFGGGGGKEGRKRGQKHEVLSAPSARPGTSTCGMSRMASCELGPKGDVISLPP